MAIPERALKRGEACPVLKQDTWRIYSMRFCPYAQRTRMVFLHKNIPHETVNVNLWKKPEWFLQRNPLGLAPIIERNSHVVYESAVCDDFLDEIYPDKPLYPSNSYEKARMRILMERFSKLIEYFYNIARRGKPIQENVDLIRQELMVFERELKVPFFGGQSVSMLDIHIWPWFERFEVFQINGLNLLEGFPKLQVWIQRMKQTEMVKATMLPAELHLQFMASLKAKQPDYDIGLSSRL